jgi:hypothetical protein
MSAIAPRQGKRPFRLLKGVASLADLADGQAALSVLMQAGGLWYYCDPTNGTSSGDGLTPQSANTNLETLYALLRTGYNDGIVFIGGATAYQPSTAGGILWSKNLTHLVGATNGLPGMGQRARIVNAAANDLSILITFSGSGCLVANMQFFDGKDSAADGACVLNSGNRNHFVNCFIAGMGDATASGPATRAGSYSLKVSGLENCFTDCTIGLDTIERTGANTELWVTGGRNRFIHCDIRCHSTTAGKFLVTIDNAAGDIRDTIFDNCFFFCYSSNWAAGINNAFDMPSGGSTHWVILQGDCTLLGTSVGWADTVTRLYTAGAAPNAGSGVAVAVTT